MPDAGFIIGMTVLGALVGYASGLFGVGGGFMLTPLLIVLYRIPAGIAVGSGLAQMIAVGLGTARRHASKGYVDGRLTGFMAIGTVVGTAIGKFIMQRLSGMGKITLWGHTTPLVNLTLNCIFIVLLVSVAIRFFRSSGEENEGPLEHAPLRWPTLLPVALPISGVAQISLVSLSLGGLLIGVISGLLGIGGGVVLIPLLVFGYGIPLRTAIGTSGMLVFVSALAGTAQYAADGLVDLGIVLPLMLGATLGVQVGAWHSHRLHTAHLQRAFAWLVLLVAGIVLVRLWG